MAFKITEECIACGACEPECPVTAIREGDPVYIIDPDKCVECMDFHEEQQCVSLCPVDCCVPDPAHRESREELLAKKERVAKK